MSRRSHKKSRAGCARCKRRHVKCDESRPICANCSTSGFDCDYAGPASTGAHARAHSHTHSHAASPAHVSASIDNSVTPGASSMQDTPASNSPLVSTPMSISLHGTDAVLDLDHLELLHHFCTETYKTLSCQQDHQHTWQVVAVRHGLSFPFLLHQILAIAALHLAQLTPSRQKHYCTKATEMQSHGLSSFARNQSAIAPSSCGAILLFSSLLALHVLADPSPMADLSSAAYLSHLIRCLALMHSVRKVVIDDWLPAIAESDLKPLLKVPWPEPPYNIPEECRALERLPQESDLGAVSRKAYAAAIERLQWMLALGDVPATTHFTIRWLLAWPLQLTDEYLTLLDERRPEALIILAYYGVLLHFHRESWAVGDAGAVLVRAIDKHVGSYWAKWMEWPLTMVGAGGDC